MSELHIKEQKWLFTLKNNLPNKRHTNIYDSKGP